MRPAFSTRFFSLLTFPRRFQITEEEKRIFSVLQETVKFASTNTVLRVAGGWVRNKLLHLGPSDMDIALDNITGAQFTKHVKKFAVYSGIPVGIGLIRVNPDQSKHLETATVTLFNSTIDLVNLRVEEYASSRIPIMKIGTPEQDARRRDFTLNSLFFNIDTDCVEDFTGLGVRDLEQRLLRTPLDPVETFHDDPLRVLRAIRFASKFGFKIEEQTLNACKAANVKGDLLQKVSRQRIGIEVRKMIENEHFLRAFNLISELQLQDVIFQLDNTKWGDTWPSAMSRLNMLHTIFPTVALSCAEDSLSCPFSHDNSVPFILAAILSDFCPETLWTGPKRFLGQETVRYPLIEYFVKTALQFTNADSETCIRLLHASHWVLQNFRSVHPKDIASTFEPRSDTETAKSLCHFVKFGGQLCIQAVWLAALRLTREEQLAKEWAQSIISVLRASPRTVITQPKLSGKDVLANTDYRGKDVGDVLDNAIIWNVTHPQATKDDLLNWLRNSYQKNQA